MNQPKETTQEGSDHLEMSEGVRKALKEVIELIDRGHNDLGRHTGGGYSPDLIEATDQLKELIERSETENQQDDVETTEDVDISTIKPGTPIRIRQAARIGFKAHWITTTVTEVNTDPNDEYIRTEDNVDVGIGRPMDTDEFSPDQLFYKGGVLHADPDRGDI